MKSRSDAAFFAPARRGTASPQAALLVAARTDPGDAHVAIEVRGAPGRAYGLLQFQSKCGALEMW